MSAGYTAAPDTRPATPTTHDSPDYRTPTTSHYDDDDNNDTNQPQAQDGGDEQLGWAELEQQKLGWMHLKVVIIAGAGFMTDAYDLFSIGIVTNNIGRIYYPDWTYYSPAQCATAAGVNPVKDVQTVCGSNFKSVAVYGAASPQYVPSGMPTGISSAIQAVALCGTLAGQLLFGWLGDRLGRLNMFQVSLAIMFFGAIAQAMSYGSTPLAVITSLCFWRFMLGIGVGGDYPLSATIMSEYSGKMNRGMLIAAVFSMQGVGYLLAGIWSLIVSAIFQNTGSDPDFLWRTILVFGAVPAATTMYARRHLPETPRYELARRQLAETGEVNLPGQQPNDAAESNWTYGQFFRSYWLLLIGTAGSWFFLDISFYSQSLLQHNVYTTTGWVPAASTMTAADEVQQTARAQTYITLAALVPGYIVSILTVEILGRWKIQFFGFMMMTLMLSLLAGLYNSGLSTNVAPFMVLYALTFFFSNFGPNTTTFIYPAEVYRTEYRSFGHGLSAAWGKAGAIIGTFAFNQIDLSVNLYSALALLAGTSFLGMLTTLCVPETKGKTLEEASNQVFHRGLASDPLSKPQPELAPTDKSASV